MNAFTPSELVGIREGTLPLTSAVKARLGALVVEKRHKIKTLSQQLNVAIKKLRKYAKATKEGRICHEKSGRPRGLDAISHALILTHPVRNRPVNEETLRGLIRSESKATKARKQNVLPADIKKAFSRRSIMRYLKFYSHHFQNS